MGDSILHFALGLVVVMWLAARRFDTPTPVRSYTTAARHGFGIAAYMWAGALVYCALGVIIWSALVPQVIEQARVPFLALALTVVLVYLPFANHAEKRLRRALRTAVGFPAEAHRL